MGGALLLLAGCVGVAGCSSNGAEPYDAGELDVFSPTEDSAAPDTSIPLGVDGGDATVTQHPDGSTPLGEDAGDSSTTVADAGADAGESDAHEQDAADASRADASDASTREDASDASSPVDSAFEDAADASVVDSSAADSASVDAASDDAGFDASAACATLGGGNPIQGVGATAAYEDGGFDQITYAYQSAPSGTGTVQGGETVYFEAWTAPIGVVDSLYGMYEVNGGSVQSLPLAQGSTINVPASGLQGWTASLSAQASGANVVWWVQGPDVCNASTNYYSNSGANYAYSTQ